MTATLSITPAEIRALYEIWSGMKKGFDRAIDCFSMTENAVVENMLLAGDNLRDLIAVPLRDYCNQHPAAKFSWDQCRDPVLSAALVAELKTGVFPDVESLYTVCGLVPFRALPYKKAAQLIATHCPWFAEMRMARNGEADAAIIELSKVSGKRAGKLHGENSRVQYHALLDWLTSRPFSHYLAELCQDVSKRLRENSAVYRDVYEDSYREVTTMNENGQFAQKARAKASDARRSEHTPAQYRIMQLGQMPDSYLETMAYRVMMRKFLADLYPKL